eukprot:1212728-Amphidinium_carterae.1
MHQSTPLSTSTLTPIDVSHVKKAEGLPKERRTFVNVVWGLLPNMDDPFDSHFNFALMDVQAAIADFCVSASAAPQLLVAKMECWPADFVKHLAATGVSLTRNPDLYEACRTAKNPRKSMRVACNCGLEVAMKEFFSSRSRLMNLHAARRYPSWDIAWASVNFQVNLDSHSSAGNTEEYGAET